MTDFNEMWKTAVAATDAQGPDWDPDPGNLTVRVAAARTETTSQDTKLARLRLRIIGGVHDGDGFDHTLFFTNDFSAAKSVTALRAYGLDVTQVETFDDLDREIATLVDVEADITVERDGKHLRVQVNDARPAVPAF
jgi:hypothetical protein